MQNKQKSRARDENDENVVVSFGEFLLLLVNRTKWPPLAAPSMLRRLQDVDDNKQAVDEDGVGPTCDGAVIFHPSIRFNFIEFGWSPGGSRWERGLPSPNVMAGN